MKVASAIFACLSLMCVAYGEAQPNVGAQLKGAFTPARAMELIYGSYEPLRGAARWQPKAANPHPGYWPDVVSVYVLIDSPYIESGTPKHLLVTWARPDETEPGKFTCHSCGGLVGLILFAKTPEGWIAQAINLNFGEYGVFGEPPAVTLQPIGPERYGLLLMTEFGSTGTLERSLEIVIPLNGTFVKAFLSQVEKSEDPKYRPENGELPILTYAGDIDMDASAHSQYYDLLLTKRIYETRTRKTSERTAIVRFRFDGKQYAEATTKPSH